MAPFAAATATALATAASSFESHDEPPLQAPRSLTGMMTLSEAAAEPK